MQHHPSRRPGPHQYSKSRESNSFLEKDVAARHDPKLALRSTNLKLLMTTAEIDNIKLAEALEMNIARVGEYLEGTRDLSEDVAKHVEEQLGLEPKFLDTKHQTPELSEKTLKILRGEFVKPEDEDDIPYPTVAPQVVKPAHTPAPAQAPALAAVATAPATVEKPTVHEVVETQVPAQAAQEEKATRIHIVPAVAPVQPRVESAEQVVPTVATRRPKVQKHSAVVVHSMAKPTQEKEVIDMAITEEAMTERRRHNFNILAAGKGAKASIARVMDISAGHVTLMVQGSRTITADTARDIETFFGLEPNWMDQKAAANRELPQTALLAIHNGKAVAQPAHAKENKPRRGRPRGSKNAATVEREAVEAAATPKQRGRKPGSGKTAPVHAPTPQAELALAEAHAAPAPAPAPAPVAAKRAKHVTAAPAHAVGHAEAAHDVQGLGIIDESKMAPVAVALLRLIVQKANEGKLGNEQAMALLPEVINL